MKKRNAKPNVNWHSAVVAGFQIELEHYRDILTYQPEFVLNKGRRRVDCLITKVPGSAPITSPIGRIFRRYNLVDYKGPGEHMTVSNLFKAKSYALSLPDFLKDSAAVDHVTLTLVTHYYPKVLISYLRKKFSHITSEPVEKIIDGLYYIHIGLIPIQLIVLPQLSPEECLWLRCLTNHLTPDTPFEALGHAYEPHQDDPVYQTFMNAVIRANSTSKGDEQLMCEALYELFADQLQERWDSGISQGASQGRKQMSSLILKLVSDNRISDIELAAADPDYCEKLMKEYQL